MCGIFGAFPSPPNGDSSILKYLRSRGPDDSGWLQFEGGSMGHTRLSIIDLTADGHQPMRDASQRYAISFNGEIYNYKELKNELEALGYSFNSRSDTEVVLNAYVAWGGACVSKFRGMFAFCIYDELDAKLFLARDRFGIKPLLYSLESGRFVFSSELEPLYKSDLVKSKVCPEALASFYQYGAVRQPLTICKGVFQLEAGHSMVVNLGDMSLRKEQYYCFRSAAAARNVSAFSYESAVVELRESLEVATRYHMLADVEVGAFLSGGVDSAAVVALMQSSNNDPISTFCVGFKGAVGVEDETDVAKRTADFIGTSHRTIKIDDDYIKGLFDEFIHCMDQPSIDGINTFIVSKETSKHVKVALSGLGGDELFAGYPHFGLLLDLARKPHSNRKAKAGRFLHKLKPSRFTKRYQYSGLQTSLAVDLVRAQHGDLAKVLKENYRKVHVSNEYSGLSTVGGVTINEVEGYLLSTLLRDGDVLSMASSLEVRPVLLDHEVAELALSFRDEYKVRDGRLKSVFIDAVADLIPEEVWQKKKTGFEMPFAKWLNGIFNDRLQNLLEQNDAQILYEPNHLNSLRRRAREKKLNRKDWADFVMLSWISSSGFSL